MIGYTTMGTNDLDRAGKFYDALLSEIGAQRAMDSERIIIWASQPGAPMFGIALPFDEKPATVGNGVMVALNVTDPDTVARMHAKALELGGSDEGAPGPRGEGGMYFGYARDLDGNKLAFYCMS